ncbi:aa3-type cytochrome c oxidase subunit IV [Rhodophyticola sp. SM2404]
MADKEHKHGEMDTTEQEKTFDGFMKWSTNVGLFAIGVVIFMALFAR